MAASGRYYSFVEDLAEYYTLLILGRIASFIGIFSLLMIGMTISLMIPILGPLTPLFFIGILSLTLVSIARFALWTIRVARVYYRSYTPPYSRDDFIFSRPESELDYHHESDGTLMRLPLAVTLAMSFFWAGVQSILEPRYSTLHGFIVWLSNILPSESIVTTHRLFSWFFGIPGPNEISLSVDFENLYSATLWIPGVVIAGIAVWNLLYYMDNFLIGDHTEGSWPNEHLKGDFIISITTEVMILLKTIKSVILGVLGAIGLARAILVKGMLLPISVLWIVILIHQAVS